MMVWVLLSFSQRATWPPSAAVRQRSIALITFIWPRLMCPALARRHAGPWSRKVSATSRAGRSTILGRYADGSAWPRRPGLLPGFWAGDLGSFLSSLIGLTTPEIMPVATRAGERFKYAANRSQLSMWLLCDAGPNLRAVMSSIMR